jgi:uncharacterized protein (TIGR01777 family)
VKVLVAGGSGLIGRALCAELQRLGHEPVVLTRQAALRMPGQVRSVVWKPPAMGPWTEELATADAVVNLAGATVGKWPWTGARKRVLRDSRLEPTNALVSAIAASPAGQRPTVVINASGTDLYEGLDAEPADEETPSAATFLATLCRDWEAEAMRASALGLRVVLARTSLVIASRAPSLRLLTLPFRLFVGGPIGSGRQWVSWIDIGDAVGLLIWAIETAGLRGPLNLSAPDPRQQAEFARVLGATLHRPAWFRTPAWAVRLALGEQATLALGSRRVWPARALACGYTFASPRLEKSLSRLIRS